MIAIISAAHSFVAPAVAPKRAFMAPLAPAAAAPPARRPPPASMLDPGGGGSFIADHSLLAACAIFLAVKLGLDLFSSPEAFLGELDEGAAAEGKSRGFGWLQADLRMPLPPWAELQEACHLVGTHGGKYMYLCASRDMGYDGCKQSSDFSDYYGKPVYVCSGGEVGGR